MEIETNRTWPLCEWPFDGFNGQVLPSLPRNPEAIHRLNSRWHDLLIGGGGGNGDRFDSASALPRRRLRFRPRSRWVRWISPFTVWVLWRRIGRILVSRLPVGRRA